VSPTGTAKMVQNSRSCCDRYVRREGGRELSFRLLNTNFGHLTRIITTRKNRRRAIIGQSGERPRDSFRRIVEKFVASRDRVSSFLSSKLSFRAFRNRKLETLAASRISGSYRTARRPSCLEILAFFLALTRGARSLSRKSD